MPSDVIGPWQVAGGIGLKSADHQVQSMQEVLKRLRKHEEEKLQEGRRMVLYTEMGRAGICFLLGETRKALEHYVDVIAQARHFETQNIKTSKTVLLHALHNLRDIMSRDGLSEVQVGDVLMSVAALEQEEDANRQEQTDMENTEVRKYAELFAQAEQEVLLVVPRECNSLKSWLQPVLQILSIDAEDVVKKVKEKLTESDLYSQKKSKQRDAHGQSLAGEFETIAQLERKLLNRMQALLDARNEVLRNLKSLPDTPAADKFDKYKYVSDNLKLVHECEECRFCHPCSCQENVLEQNDLNCLQCSANHNKKGEKCTFCWLSQLMIDYQQRHLYYSESVKTGASTSAVVRRERLVVDEPHEPQEFKLSELEKVLCLLVQLVGKEDADDALCTDAKLFLEIFAHLKKELRMMHNVWRVQLDRVQKMMELERATWRVRFQKEDKKIDVTKRMYVVKTDQLTSCPSYWQKQRQKQIYSQKQVKPEECCVPCRLRKLVEERTKADSTVSEAQSQLKLFDTIAQGSEGTNASSLCKHIHGHPKGDREGIDDDEVKGDTSTKIESLVRGLRKLQEGEKAIVEKAIVFSEWDDMLKLMSKALEANNIDHLCCVKQSSKDIGMSLKTFKEEPGKRALLLPLRHGSNGLNLIEATHVFLMEPILNVGVEAQAIGRVHRIGQLNATTVHRMIVTGTVEERVRELGLKKMAALKDDASSRTDRAATKQKEAVTLDDMEALFVDSSNLARPEPCDSHAVGLSHKAVRGKQADCTSNSGGDCDGSGWGGVARASGSNGFASDGSAFSSISPRSHH